MKTEIITENCMVKQIDGVPAILWLGKQIREEKNIASIKLNNACVKIIVDRNSVMNPIVTFLRRI